MNEQLISVIIGSYNNGNVIHETIESFTKQTYQNIEILLVDDGSTDNTFEVMNQYKDKDSRIKVFSQENKGASAARELGYLHATGDFIFLSDADDVWDSEILSDLKSLLDNNLESDFAVTYYRKESNGQAISDYDWSKHKEENRVSDDEVISGRELAERFLVKDDVRVAGFWGTLYRRSFFEKLYSKMLTVKEKIPTHFFNDSYCVAQICGLSNSVVLSGKVQVLYRISPTSLSRKQNVSEHVKNYIYAAEEGIKLYKELNWDDTYRQHLLHFYLVILKSWFRVNQYEKNEDEKARYDAEINRLYNAYHDDFSNFSYKNKTDFVYVICVKLWRISKPLWIFFVKTICGW